KPKVRPEHVVWRGASTMPALALISTDHDCQSPGIETSLSVRQVEASWTREQVFDCGTKASSFGTPGRRLRHLSRSPRDLVRCVPGSCVRLDLMCRPTPLDRPTTPRGPDRDGAEDRHGPRGTGNTDRDDDVRSRSSRPRAERPRARAPRRARRLD